MSDSQEKTVLVERQGAVGIVRLNRPSALNALSAQLITELGEAFDDLEFDPAIGAIVLTGSERAFAAGAVCVLAKPLDLDRLRAVLAGPIPTGATALREGATI